MVITVSNENNSSGIELDVFFFEAFSKKKVFGGLVIMLPFCNKILILEKSGLGVFANYNNDIFLIRE